jgi:hypothetical protein
MIQLRLDFIPEFLLSGQRNFDQLFEAGYFWSNWQIVRAKVIFKEEQNSGVAQI